MPRKVFISYSHADRSLFNDFRKHLRLWEDTGQLDVWVDEIKIDPGEKWDERIRQGMEESHGAVVIVSPDLFASEYAGRHEIPMLMEAAEAGRLVLMPLFLRDTNAHVRTYDVVDAQTGEKGVALTKYEGLNKPSEPLANYAPSERDSRFKSCASKLWAALEQRQEPDARRRQTRATLTVELRRRGRDEVAAFYYDGAQRIHSDQHTIDSRLQSWPDGRLSDEQLGEALWNTLFQGEDWRRILTQILHKTSQSPIQCPVRIRLRTEDTSLRSLPWSLARWREHFVSSLDWTFELAAGDSPRPVERVDTPCTAIMIASPDSESLDLKIHAHHLSFGGLLSNIWEQPGRTEVASLVTDPRRAVEILQRGPVPRLVYVYCPTVEGADELVFRFSRATGSETLRFTDLARAWKSHPPQIVFLNTIGKSPLAPEADVPLLVHRREERDPESARRHAQRWWLEVLGHGSDPVRAVYNLGAAAWRTTAVQTRFETFEVKVRDRTPKSDRPRAFLDRIVQRNAVRGAIEELIRTRRVLCVVVFGASGSLVDHFPTQMIATLRESDSDRVRVHHMPLRFRRRRDEWDEAQIETDFREQSELQPAEGLEAAFGRVRIGGARAAPLFFLDWGTYGTRSGEDPPLRSVHLRTWLRFCRDRLDRACTGHARVLAYVGIETPPERFEQLREWAEKIRAELRAQHFDFIVPEPLGLVTANDLAHFLVDEGNSSCPREYVRELPERIISKTRGDFEATVKLLEDAEQNHMWPELTETLPTAARRARQPQDPDFEL